LNGIQKHGGVFSRKKWARVLYAEGRAEPQGNDNDKTETSKQTNKQKNSVTRPEDAPGRDDLKMSVETRPQRPHLLKCGHFLSNWMFIRSIYC
jgi:hypothetical protein